MCCLRVNCIYEMSSVGPAWYRHTAERRHTSHTHEACTPVGASSTWQRLKDSLPLFLPGTQHPRYWLFCWRPRAVRTDTSQQGRAQPQVAVAVLCLSLSSTVTSQQPTVLLTSTAPFWGGDEALSFKEPTVPAFHVPGGKDERNYVRPSKK